MHDVHVMFRAFGKLAQLASSVLEVVSPSGSKLTLKLNQPKTSVCLSTWIGKLSVASFVHRIVINQSRTGWIFVYS